MRAWVTRDDSGFHLWEKEPEKFAGLFFGEGNITKLEPEMARHLSGGSLKLGELKEINMEPAK